MDRQEAGNSRPYPTQYPTAVSIRLRAGLKRNPIWPKIPSFRPQGRGQRSAGIPNWLPLLCGTFLTDKKKYKKKIQPAPAVIIDPADPLIRNRNRDGSTRRTSDPSPASGAHYPPAHVEHITQLQSSITTSADENKPQVGTVNVSAHSGFRRIKGVSKFWPQPDDANCGTQYNTALPNLILFF